MAQLLGMYHRRIEYPQNKIVELESRRAAAGGGWIERELSPSAGPLSTRLADRVDVREGVPRLLPDAAWRAPSTERSSLAAHLRLRRSV